MKYVLINGRWRKCRQAWPMPDGSLYYRLPHSRTGHAKPEEWRTGAEVVRTRSESLRLPPSPPTTEVQ